MTTTYRLPEALGGGEVEMVDTPIMVEGTPVRTQSGDVLLVPMSLLVEIPPTEPEPGLYALGNVMVLRFAKRADEGDQWFWAIVDDSAGDCGWLPWKSLWRQFGGPDVAAVPLVPDPFAGPIVLPWQRKVGRHTTVTVDRTGIDEISLHLSSGGYAVAPDITADEARSVARALWAAADGSDHAEARQP